MDENEWPLREALAKIAEAANAALTSHGGKVTSGGTTQDPELHCVPRRLPTRLLEKAAQTAVRVNPVNDLRVGPMGEVDANLNLTPLFIAVMTTKYWGPQPRRLTVSFMDGGSADLRRKIVSHLNAWNLTAGISFVETKGVGQVRISRAPGGYWSYIGTDILYIPHDRPTMNLEGFTMNTPDGEFRRVVRHEAGHTLGFPHEHMREELVARIDPAKAYEYFWRTQGWNKGMVDMQVLAPLNQRSIMGTKPEEDSNMCYHLPGSITRDGKPILGGHDITETDYAFAGRIYPKTVSGQGPDYQRDLGQREDRKVHEGDWSEAQDVEVTEDLLR